jgi:hypothetical protein
VKRKERKRNPSKMQMYPFVPSEELIKMKEEREK